MADLIEATIGRWGIDPDDSLISFDEGSGLYELLFVRGDELLRLEVLPDARTISGRQLFSEDGSSMLDIGYSDFIMVGRYIRAKKIEITNPIRAERVTVEIRKERIGVELPDRIFEMSVPENTAVQPLD